MKKKWIILAAALISGFSAAAEQGVQDYNWSKPDGLCEIVECIISGLDDEPKVAIDPILDDESKKAKNCNVRNYDVTWQNREEYRAFYLYVTTPKLKKDEWLTSTFSFRIRGRYNGRIRILLRAYGNYAHTDRKIADAVFMGVAQISSPQISFPNGGYFPDKNLRPWCFKESKDMDKNLLPTVESDDTLTTPGKRYLRTRQTLVHYVDVKPGQEYTISFTVKPMEYFKALH